MLAEEDFGAVAVGLLKYISTDQERRAHIYRCDTSRMKAYSWDKGLVLNGPCDPECLETSTFRHHRWEVNYPPPRLHEVNVLLQYT